MSENRKDIKIDKTHETRTKEISRMIDEGGLGADKYYKIQKDTSTEEVTDEGSEDTFS